MLTRDKTSSVGDALHALAVRQGGPEIAEALLDAGIHPAYGHETDPTLLHQAISVGNADIVGALAVACPQDLNVVRESRSRYEQTPLSLAIESGNVVVVEVAPLLVGDQPQGEAGRQVTGSVERGVVARSPEM